MSKMTAPKLALCIILLAAPAAAKQWAVENTDTAAASAPDPQRAEPITEPAPEASPSPAAPVEAASRPASDTRRVALSTPVASVVPPAVTTAGPVSNAQCRAATTRLAQLQAQEEKLWSSQNEASELYRVWSSSTCKAERRGKSNIQQDLDNAMLLLQSKGSDIEAQLAGETAKCDASAATKWNSEDAAFRRQHSKADLAQTCMLNTRITLYAEALNRLNANSQSSFNAAQDDYNKARAKYEADQRAFEAERAEWQRRTDLCNAGKVKYCSAK